MKNMVAICLLMAVSSCASHKANKERLDTKITSQEVKTLSEIQIQTQKLVDAHPELSPEAKQQLTSCLNETVSEQRALRDEESKVVQLLLQKSLRVNSLTAVEKKDKQALKKKLNAIYVKKSDNITHFINKIVDLSKKNEVNDQLQADMLMFIRDLR